MPDPDPFAAVVVADLPAIDEPSGRQRRIAAGLALVRAGTPLYKAAKEVEIPYTTLWRAHHGISNVNHSGADARSNVETDLLDISLAVALRGSHELLKMIEDQQMRPAEVAKAVQITRDTTAMLRGWKDNTGQGDNATQNALAAALDMIRGKRVTIEDADPVDNAIDVSRGTVDRDE